MNCGRLRHKIDIQIESTAQNSYGEQTQSWSNYLSSIWASIDPIAGKEYFASDKLNADVSHKIRIRFRTGILPKMRVKYNSRYFDIISVINFEERGKELLLMCKEAV
jgi:SPP1 family predicted phage head-tail adaptor